MLGTLINVAIAGLQAIENRCAKHKQQRRPLSQMAVL